MTKPPRILIAFLIGFILSLTVLFISVDIFISVEFTDQLIQYILFISLIVGGIGILAHKGKSYFSQVPFIAGLLLFLVGAGLLYGNVESEALGKTLWWQIHDTDDKVILGAFAVVGFLLLIGGAKVIGGTLPYSHPFGKRRGL